MLPIGTKRLASVFLCEKHANEPNVREALDRLNPDSGAFPSAADLIELVEILNEQGDLGDTMGLRFSYRDNGSECAICFAGIPLWTDADWNEDFANGDQSVIQFVVEKFAALADALGELSEKLLEPKE
jgi:hypothetical protein